MTGCLVGSAASKGVANAIKASTGAHPEKVPFAQGDGAAVPPSTDCLQKVPAGQGRAPANVVFVALQNVPSGQPVHELAEALL